MLSFLTFLVPQLDEPVLAGCRRAEDKGAADISVRSTRQSPRRRPWGRGWRDRPGVHMHSEHGERKPQRPPDNVWMLGMTSRLFVKPISLPVGWIRHGSEC